jgi:hypothetical protein
MSSRAAGRSKNGSAAATPLHAITLGARAITIGAKKGLELLAKSRQPSAAATPRLTRAAAESTQKVHVQ